MHVKTKLPEGLCGIAKIMQMEMEEIKYWRYYPDVKNLFKNYNFGIIAKDSLISDLIQISVKCANDKIYYYSTGIDNAIETIRLLY